MKLTYDPRYNVAYIHLKEKTAEVEAVHISEELNIDLAPDGTVYGIKLLLIFRSSNREYSCPALQQQDPGDSSRHF